MIRTAFPFAFHCAVVTLLFVGRGHAHSGREIIEATGTDGGVVVHIGCGDGRLTAELRGDERFVVHGLDTDAAKIEAARRYLRSQKLYGPVSVDTFDGRRLPYAENLVNLIVADELGDVTMNEVMRVLRPLGVAYVKRDSAWTKTVKPWPAEIDQWTHFLHGADGNPVARDEVVGPPRRYQWLAGPLWLRSHESDSSVRTLVTAAGRLFYIVDEAPAGVLGPEGPPDKWFLRARDAFNGAPLWKVPIVDWGWRAWKPSWFTPRPGGIPLNIEKRLIAVDDRVYVTLGYRAPISQLDASTGQTLQTYAGTEWTGELLYVDGKLVVTTIDNDRVSLSLLDTDSGKRLWTSEKDYGGTVTDYYRFTAMHGQVKPAKVDPTLNTATDGQIVALLDGQDVVALDFATGEQRWRSTFPLVPADLNAGRIAAKQTLWVGTLIVRDGVVLHASPYQLAAFSAATGELLWQQPKRYLQHLWFEWKDVFVIDDLVWTWSAEVERGKLEGGAGGTSTWPVSANGYDLHTGELKKEVPLGNIFKTHHHHRCYRNKATVRYILASRRGTEFVDLRQGQHTVDNWIRGTCHVGMMPANGLHYAPPHPCQCYIDEKLNGFNVLAPAAADNDATTAEPPSPRLVRGPAFGEALPVDSPSADDWPTYRHDALRSGAVATELPPRPERLWETQLGGKVGAPIVVGDRLFVPLIDEHHLVALNAADGAQQWEFATGGRIDTPPTYHRGQLLFGSADGWVYCVRATDGALAWRFRAAPQERRIGAFDQLESAWPVHGSVLVLKGVVYFAAGRSSQVDGGIYLYGVDVATGELRYQTELSGPHYGVDDIEQNYVLPMGSLPDVLQSNGRRVFMRNLVFDDRLEQLQPPLNLSGRRVRAPGGMLDDSYFKRIPWQLGGGPYGRLIVHDDRHAFYVRQFDSLQGLNPNVYFTPGKQGYLLLAVDQQARKEAWSRRIRVRINTMVAAENALVVAGMPDLVDPQDPLAAFEGRKGGVLEACDRQSGEAQWQVKLPSPTVYNGLAAASGRLIAVLQDGHVVCFGSP